jgi:hypothetical protein
MRLTPKVPFRSMSSTSFSQRAFDILNEASSKAKKSEESNKAWLAKENKEFMPKEFYKHPYCTTDFPMMTSPNHTTRIVLEVLGPEMVSPHYQSILEFGKWYNYFFIGVLFTIAMRDHHNHAWGYSVLNMQYGFEIWVYTYYYYFLQTQGFIFPNPWKDLWKSYNLRSMIASVYEIEENLSFELRKPSVDQMDYFRAHQEYLGTKAKIIENHMKNAKMQLKKHTYERAIFALRTTEKFEKDNLSRAMRKVLDDAMEKLQKDIEGNASKEILKEAFKSSLLGISKGKMTYEQDPLLPRLLKYIDEFKLKAESMSEKEEAELLGLTKEQKAVLAGYDQKSEESFLKALPSIKHPRILNSPKFKALSG